MSHNPFAGWPDDLIQSYKELPLPTLYDFAVSEEKLGAEIRRQNKEIKALTDKIVKMGSSLENEVARQKSLPSEEKKRYQHSLMQAFDALAQLEDQVHKSMEETSKKSDCNKRLTKKKHEKSKKTDSILESLLQGVSIIQEKFLSSLADVDLEPFSPKQGDAFYPEEHRAVLQTEGGVRGQIHKTIRLGYKTAKEILRCADVVIYQSKKKGDV